MTTSEINEQAQESRPRVGVVGIGHLGSLHAKMYAEIGGAEFTAVYDVDPARYEPIRSLHPRLKFCNSLEELLGSVDAVSIAAVTSRHHELARRALEAGVDVLIEKPITETVAEADELLALAASKGRIIQVGHIERFNPAILALESYTLKPMFIESHRLSQFNPRGTDVAVVLDLMIHDIDVIMSLVKSPVSRIDANGVAVVSDSVDIANARIQFENGCVANVTASRISQNKMRKMRMFQFNAYISIDFLQGLAEVFRLVGDGEDAGASTMLLGQIGEGKKKRNIVYEQPEVKEVNALKYELESFISAVRSRRQPVVTGEDGRRALEVAQRIMNSIQVQRFGV
ncbi:MAG TPA: Gfo/Idh/MocA family oxidoreductase [Bacteroidota bacterium]|nr:Gfo/Idh/MocA family oxidoreductase [Bacteroidota bacterium]